MILFMLVIVTFSWIHQKKKGKDESRKFAAQSEYRARLNEMRIQQEEKERLRFSRDLRKETDEMAQSIRELQRLLSADPSLKEKLSGLSDKLSRSADRIGHISRQIAPAMLSESGLPGALESMVSHLRPVSKADIFFAEKNYQKQDDLVEITLFRVAEEIVANALRHGKPNRIDLFLTGDDRRVMLEIHDNGLPFDLQQKLSEDQVSSPGSGLKNIAHRLQGRAELLYAHTEGANRNRIVWSKV